MTTRDTDLTRNKLLTAAFCEIHRQGYQAASIANILHDTGLTKGALYHHFPTKHDLGLAVVDEVIHSRLEQLIFRPIRDSAEPVAALLAIIDTIGERRDAEFIRLGCPLNNLMQEMSPLDANFKDRLNAILAEWGQVIEAALQRAQQAGTIKTDVDCRAAALFVVSAWEGCIGIAKSLQSTAGFSVCMGQLRHYLMSLMATPN
jgi:TetR/AcrR family transcriptional regulator, transcriptional repressor for nem operon